jgi:hypothetical protein
MIFRKFFNSFPYPEEVIRIDRSKIGNKPSDIIMESYIDYGFKKELLQLYGIGFLTKKLLLNFESNKLF